MVMIPALIRFKPKLQLLKVRRMKTRKTERQQKLGQELWQILMQMILMKEFNH
jgi:hypothetical protein